MLFWITLAVLAAAVSLALMRAAGPAMVIPDRAGDVAVYKDQLAELDADADRGLIGAEEATAARLEVSRRLLKAAGPAGSPHSASHVPASGSAARILTLAAAAIPLLSVGLYLRLGSPGLPARPLAARIDAPLSAANSPEGVNDMMAKVEAELREHPEDARGWTVIAPVYLSQGRAAEAASAYGRAILYGGETIERLSGLAQATLVTTDGIMSDMARKAYQKALKLDPSFAEAKFWLAIDDEQNGRPDAAITGYRHLSAEVPADSPWRGAAEERIAALAGPGGHKPLASDTAALPAPAPSAADRPRREPTPAEFVAAAQQLAPEMRDAMIGGRMIPKAQAAVATNPKDVAAWSRIVTGHAALGHASEARAALEDARKAAAGDAPMLSSLDTLARELGLNS